MCIFWVVFFYHSSIFLIWYFVLQWLRNPRKKAFYFLKCDFKMGFNYEQSSHKTISITIIYSSLLKCKTTGFLTHDCRRKKKFNLILKGHFHFSDNTMVLRYGSLHIQTLKKNYFSVLNFCSVLTFSIMWYLLTFEFLKSRSIRSKCDTVSNV